MADADEAALGESWQGILLDRHSASGERLEWEVFSWRNGFGYCFYRASRVDPLLLANMRYLC